MTEQLNWWVVRDLRSSIETELALANATARGTSRSELVTRTVTTTESPAEAVVVPLPDALGSVVKATYQGRTVHAFRRDPSSAYSSQWCLDRMVNGILYVSGESLSDVETVFEPTA